MSAQHQSAAKVAALLLFDGAIVQVVRRLDEIRLRRLNHSLNGVS
jgi:hypothetical protein